MIYDLKRIVDLRRLFDPVLHSSIDGTKNIARIANAVQVTLLSLKSLSKVSQKPLHLNIFPLHIQIFPPLLLDQIRNISLSISLLQMSSKNILPLLSPVYFLLTSDQKWKTVENLCTCSLCLVILPFLLHSSSPFQIQVFLFL